MSVLHFYKKSLFLTVFLLAAVAANAQQYLPEINAYLQNVRQAWNLDTRDIQNWRVSDQYTNRQTGITHTYLHQEVNGIRIFNAVSSMAIRDGRVAYFANRFYARAAEKINTGAPTIGPDKAIEMAAAQLGLTLTQTPGLLVNEAAKNLFIYSDGGIAKRPVKVELMYVPVENTLRLAWNVNIDLRHSSDWLNLRIDAQNGQFIDQNNWTTSCDFGPGHAPDGACTKSHSAEVPAQAETLNGNTYNVYPLPLEAPSFGDRSLLSDPQSPVASPYGWHDTDGAAGAEYTITRGNNVHAYEDRDDNDEPGYSPDGGAELHFDFALDLSLAPAASQDAIITNLFYMNNSLHDILYLHGFDEESGNFQQTNYSGAGLGDDYVRAEAQDGGGSNNANFATPDDGQSGRMQMYLWPGSEPGFMTVHSPAVIAGDYVAVEASFGPGLSGPLFSQAILMNDNTGSPVDGCDSILNAAEFAGKIVVVDRGGCPFIEKVQAAEQAGAIAVIVCNNAGGPAVPMSGSGFVGIPSVMISQADGALLKARLVAGDSVSLTLNPSPIPARDGSLDNGIIAHEFGHGVSNRLTGGPSNTNCLGHAEQGGEGWSDWLALILTIEPGDAGADPRGIGTYALTENPDDLGIRRFRYSTDFSVNAQSYADLAQSGAVHDIGEIWSQTLWDMTWKLIDLEGFDPDWYNGTGGNITALRLVLEGMKLQPCGPGYIDARDAILAADDLLYNKAHRCLIWEAFAGRGMGYFASQGSAGATGDETENFDLPPFCLTAITTPTANFTVNATSNCTGDFRFTDQSTDIPQNWLWSFGDGATSDDINPSHTYTVPGVYDVVLIVTNTLGADTFSLSVAYDTYAAPAVSGDTEICQGELSTLNAVVEPGNTALWGIGNNVLFTGTSFTTPILPGTTTFSVRQTEDKPIGQVGPPDNTFGGGGNHATGFDGRLLFEAYQPVRILSVKLYAQGDGNRTIRLFSEDGTLLESVTVFVPNGESRVSLNIEVPAAGKYSLSNISQNLYRNNNGAAYPYTLDNLVQIYSSNATNDGLSYYYYFYDWEVQELTCIGVPTEVTVNVLPAPQAAFSTEADNLSVTFTDNSTGNPLNWLWNFGDGSAPSTTQNPVHVYAAPGTYTVSLQVTDSLCSNTFQQIITVTDGTSGVFYAAGDFGIHLYPNPARDEVNIELDQALSGDVRLELSDASGRLVLAQALASGARQYSIRTADLPGGVYQVRLTAREGTAVRKLTLLR